MNEWRHFSYLQAPECWAMLLVWLRTCAAKLTLKPHGETGKDACLSSYAAYRSYCVFWLSQISPVHALQSCFLKIRSNIVFLSKPRSCKWLLSFRFLYKNPVCISLLHHTCHISPTSSSLIWPPKHLLLLVKLLLTQAQRSPTAPHKRPSFAPI